MRTQTIRRMASRKGGTEPSELVTLRKRLVTKLAGREPEAKAQ
jgi:hypothetical protein